MEIYWLITVWLLIKIMKISLGGNVLTFLNTVQTTKESRTFIQLETIRKQLGPMK